MNDASWLWQVLRDLFEVDDGSLPEIWLTFQDTRAVVAGYELVRSQSAGVVSKQSYLWSKVTNDEVELSAVPNPAALVVSGEAEPFHVVFGGVESNGVVIPDLGVFVFPSQLVLDYRMGPEWSGARVNALFELLAQMLVLDRQATLSLEEYVLPEVQSRFKSAWQRWSVEHAA